MCRIANNGLVEITYLNRDPALRIGEWTQVSDMAIAANPDRRPDRNFTGTPVEPLVKLLRAPSHIGVRRPGHFQVAGSSQYSRPVGRLYREGNLPNLLHCRRPAVGVPVLSTCT